MYELMCWCWSEKPNCRPTFSQIKEIIKTGAFTYLFGATTLTTDHDCFTSACIHTYKLPSFNQHDKDISTSSVAPSQSVVNLLAASIIEDNGTRVWYGTEKGKLAYVQFLSSDTASEVM